MPAVMARGLPERVPAWYIGPAGATISMMSLRPPYAPTGSPPPITYIIQEKKTVLPDRGSVSNTAGEATKRQALRRGNAEDMEEEVFFWWGGGGESVFGTPALGGRLKRTRSSSKILPPQGHTLQQL